MNAAGAALMSCVYVRIIPNNVGRKLLTFLSTRARQGRRGGSEFFTPETVVSVVQRLGSLLTSL